MSCSSVFAIAGLPDQPDVPSFPTSPGLSFSPGIPIGQSFTAGITGSLDQVEVYLATLGQEGFVEISIHEGTAEDGDLNQTPLGSSPTFIETAVGAPIPVLAFFQGINVVAGQKYSIAILPISQDPIEYWISQQVDYLGGMLTTEFGIDPTSDLAFQTYVTPSGPGLSTFEQLCGTTIAGDEVVSVNDVSGATQYFFEFAPNGGSPFVEVRNSSTLDFSTISNPSLMTGASYNVTVKANDSVPRSIVVSSCALTVASLTTTQLTSADCGATFTSWSDAIDADAVTGASQYIFNITDGGLLNIEKIRNSPSLTLSDIRFLLEKGTTYSVRVKSVVGGERSDFGSTCSITTPGASQGAISNCGTTFTAWNQTVDATTQDGAESYHFRFDDGGAPVNLYSNSASMRIFKGARPLAASTTYDVRVAVRKGGVWGQLSDAGCSFTTPGFDLAREGFTATGENISMYPNPVADQFVYFTSALHNVTVYDALGGLVSEGAVMEALDVSAFDAGIYFVKSDEGVSRLVVE